MTAPYCALGALAPDLTQFKGLTLVTLHLRSGRKTYRYLGTHA